MEMSQESVSESENNLGWRIKNMAKYNNKIINNVNKFRISGFENNALMSKEHHLNDIIHLCSNNGILVDMQEISDDLDKPDYRKFIDDGSHKTMWSIVVKTANVNVADFVKPDHVPGLLIYNGTYVRPLANLTLWRGFHNSLIIQAVESQEQLETIVYYVRGIPMHSGEVNKFRRIRLNTV